jgi:hypothetical protein
VGPAEKERRTKDGTAPQSPMVQGHTLRRGYALLAMSAGTEATHVRPLAIRAMEEIGVDISDQGLAVFRSVRDQIRERIEVDLVATDGDTPTS